MMYSAKVMNNFRILNSYFCKYTEKVNIRYTFYNKLNIICKGINKVLQSYKNVEDIPHDTSSTLRFLVILLFIQILHFFRPTVFSTVERVITLIKRIAPVRTTLIWIKVTSFFQIAN